MSPSTVLTARVSEDEVAVLDAMIAAGLATDRSSALRSMIAREKRRQQAERDAGVLAAFGPDPELDDIAEWAGEQDQDLD